MRSLPSFPGSSRWLALLLCMIACGSVASAQVMTITGKVYSPLGPATGDPIPNILVYVAQSPVLPFSSTVGPGVTGGCSAQTNLVSGNPLVSALTAADGSFTLSSANMPNPANIVIQAGKWRRQYPATTLTGSTTTLQLTMPANQSQGDLPHIAVVTGAADGIECIFNQIGITTTGANNEITDPTGTGSINFYQGAGVPGQKVSTSTPAEAALVGSPSTLANYDVVIFGCQGTPGDSQATAANQQNIIDFANNGGRVFATHYGYVWLDNLQPFKSSAVWNPNKNSLTPAEPATIDQTYPEGAILAQWLQNIGASYNNTKGQILLQQTRVDTNSVNKPPSQSWVTLNNVAGNPSMQFTFNTPIGATGIPSVGITYTNTTTSFFQGDTADSITINATNNSATAADSSLTLALALPGGLTPTNLTDSTGGWACNLATLVCTRSTSLAAGASDPVNLTFSIDQTTIGQASLTASLSGGGLSGTNQCGRVLFNDYHVESGTGNVVYPKDCPAGTITPQEKFLEFSLYNLSNFVAPTTTDLIVIQGLTTLTWPQPAGISYGTPLTGTQLDATATDVASGISIPGTFVYTPTLGATVAASSTCPNLSVTFTPTDAADYSTATATACLQVMQDTTATTLTTPVTPIHYGEVIAQAAVGSTTSNGPATTLDGGALNFYINGAVVCTLPEPILPSSSNCPPSAGAGYSAGSYNVYAAYSGDANFAGSASATYPVVVLPDPTTTTLTSSATNNTSTPGQPVTFTATVTNAFPPTVTGTVNFYDGTTLLGPQSLPASGIVTLTLSNLIAGPHSITACYIVTLNFTGSCSSAVLQIVTFPPTITPTTTLLSSGPNPSIVGQSVTFSASVATSGAFVAVPTGTVNFYDGTSLLGPATLDANGNAAYSTSTLTAGLHNITAIYTGTATMATSTSPVVQQQVDTSLTAATPGFLMTITPTTFSVGAGSSISLGVSILELNNFNQPVQLTCSNLPSEVTCAFVTATIPASGGTTQLLVSPAAAHNCGSNAPYFVAGFGNTAFPLVGLAALVFFARRRRVLKGLVLAAALCILPAISGCGGNCTDLAVKPGTYTFTVTGTSTPVGPASTTTTVTHSQAMTMTVTI